MGGVTPAANFPKQAIVVIHGIGEQMPMDTVRGFVRAVWESDPAISVNGMPRPGEVWSKPDAHTGSLELRRITTRPSRPSTAFPKGARSDFYELYWADLSAGSTLGAVESWIIRLLLRNPFTGAPPRLRLALVVLWLASALAVLLLITSILPADVAVWTWPPWRWVATWPRWIWALAAAAIGVFAHALLVPYLGRIARWTRATPDNIAARQAIRERGLALLNGLHGGEYERIVIVGHSLGSMLAYDLIAHLWASRLAAHTIVEGSPEFAALKAVEIAVAGAANGDAAAVARFHDARRAFAAALRKRPKPGPGEVDTRWLVTDLVTLGSPLTHAEFLLTSNAADLEGRIAAREYPISPPLRELLDDDMKDKARAAGLPFGDPAELMAFKFGGDHWQLHHAAPYAAVKWTNIHDNSRFVFCGDIISGPVAPLFGPGVADIDLAGLRGQSWSFTHTKYWDIPGGNDPPEPLRTLRNALDLAGDGL